MQITNISPSKLEQIRLCEARADARINDAEYEEEHGEPARIGTLAHAAAKAWYRPLAHTYTPDGFINTVSYGLTNPDDAFKAGIHECGTKTDRDGKLASELPNDPSSIDEARMLFDQIVSFYPRDQMKVLFAERRYMGTLANGVPVHLIIDLGVDVGNGMLDLLDYKTGFLACSTEEMWDKDQVRMNLLAVCRDPVFAQYRNRQFKYLWVRKGYETGPILLRPEQLNDYEHYLAMEYTRIRAITEPREQINRFCKSCGRRFQCKAYAQFLAEAFGQVQPFTEEQMKAMPLADVMSRFDTLKGQIDKLEEVRGFLGTIIKGAMEQARATEVTDGGFKASLRANRRESHDVKTVLELCQQHNINAAPMLNARDKEVTSTFGSMPEAMQRLNVKMSRGATSPFVVVSPLKQKKSKAQS